MGRDLPAQTCALLLATWRLGDGGQDASAHDDHRRAAAAAQQLRARAQGCGALGTLGALSVRSDGLFEHQQAQQRDQPLAVGAQKPMVARPPKTFGQHMLQHSHKKVAPLTVRSTLLPVLLSRQRGGGAERFT